MKDAELSSVDLAPPSGPGTSTPAPPRRIRGRHVAVVLLALYVLAALVVAWQRWGQFDPNVSSQAREIAHIELDPAQHPWYFPMLLLHVTASSIALATAVFQIWPWLRRAHPRAHRTIGRVYAFAGVYPAVFFALVVQAFWAFSVPTAISQIVPLILWTATTTYGIVLRRRGRIEEHRRYMLRSFALTCLVLMELTIDLPVQLLIGIQFHSRLGSNMDIYMQVKDTTENWLGLVLMFVIVELWLERRPRVAAGDAHLLSR
ncbi:DUF2306 domain-containing protein [Amycolatopsis sacchari]|uniref:DUF2306 domain-containing protein n=1 Tax=Amycolatopsis sacchari TaxID=115433 RepID=UPI003D75D1B8